jgi:hypothetical protein
VTPIQECQLSHQKAASLQPSIQKKRKLQVHQLASNLLLHEAALTGTLTNNSKEDVWSSGADYASIINNSGGPINDEAPHEDHHLTFPLFIYNGDGDESFVGDKSFIGNESLLATRMMRKKMMMMKTLLVAFCHAMMTQKKLHANVPMNCPLTCLPVMAFHQPQLVTTQTNCLLFTKM